VAVYRKSAGLEAGNTHRGLRVGVAIPFEERLK